MIANERQLVEAIAEMREEEAYALAKAMLDRGEDPVRVLELCRAAMDIVGKRFENLEYFLPELMLAGEMLENIGAIARPLILEKSGRCYSAAASCIMICWKLRKDYKKRISRLSGLNSFIPFPWLSSGRLSRNITRLKSGTGSRKSQPIWEQAILFFRISQKYR